MTVALGAAIRKEFPLLARSVDGAAGEPGDRLVYLDSAATSQKPQIVLDAMDEYYANYNANVHRGVYRIAAEATDAMEKARSDVAALIGARSANEIVFTKNATESLNLVAHSWGRRHLNEGDAVVLTHMEHHANIVPWHLLAAERGIELRWIPLTEDGQLDLDNFDEICDGAKLLSITAMSNVLGTINPVARLAARAKALGLTVCVDACQSVPHSAVDVTELGADLMAFSGHKMCGPTGIGVLWARREVLENMSVFMGGGEMIKDVRLDGFLPNDIPHRFEAGTPPIAEIVGLGAAVGFLQQIGMDAIAEHEHRLTAYALRTLTSRFGDRLRIHGPSEPNQRGGVMSFSIGDVHPHDVSQILDTRGVCVRAGHHCAKPLMRLLGVGATARASWYLYNEESDIDALAEALEATADLFI